MDQYRAKQLREQRAKAHAFAATLLGGNGLTNESRGQFDAAMADVDRLTKEIAVEENGAGHRSYTATDIRHEARHAEAFGRYLRRGQQVLTDAQRKILVERRDETEGVPITSHVGSYSSLGFFVPTGFVNDIEEAQRYFAPVLDIFGSIVTGSGNPLPYPTSNDVDEVAEMVGESNPVSEKDIESTNHIIFGAWKMSSGLIKCSLELLQDSAFDVEAYIAKKFGERWGRGLERKLTTGSGSSEPSGIITEIAASGAAPVIAGGSSANDGNTANTGANSIGYDDLVALEHSVDPAYRNGARFMLHDLTLAKLKKLLDKFGRPLWVPGIAVSEPSTILGYPYVINQAMDQIGASKTTMVFGRLDKYMVRKVKDMSVQRLEELYAVNGQIGFISFARVDGRLVDAGTHPVNVLQQAS